VEVRRAEVRAYLTSRNLPWREDASNAEAFTARNRWRPLLEAMRLEAPELDRHLFETHRQAAEAEALAKARIAEWEGSRWQLEAAGIRLARVAWTEPELRWTLETAFHRLGWVREAALLRGLAPWLLARLAQGRKPSAWGNFALNLEPDAGYLHLTGVPPPSRS
jgi:hypothetical protein